MTSQLCTEESTFSPLHEGHSIDKGTIFLPASYVEQIQTTNGVDLDLISERSPLSIAGGGENGQKTQQPTNTVVAATTTTTREPPILSKSGNRNNTPSFCDRYWKKILLVIVLVVLVLSVTVLSVATFWISTEISKIKELKSVMLLRPTEKYLQNIDRAATIKWSLVEKHSQSPFKQHNTTHLQVKKDGFYHISCSLLMQTNNTHTNVITLLIFYSNEKNSIYTKKTMPTGFSRFSLQQSIVLHLQQGAYFYVQVIPSKHLLKDPGASYLSIVQQ